MRLSEVLDQIEEKNVSRSNYIQKERRFWNNLKEDSDAPEVMTFEYNDWSDYINRKFIYE